MSLITVEHDEQSQKITEIASGHFQKNNSQKALLREQNVLLKKQAGEIAALEGQIDSNSKSLNTFLKSVSGVMSQINDDRTDVEITEVPVASSGQLNAIKMEPKTAYLQAVVVSLAKNLSACRRLIKVILDSEEDVTDELEEFNRIMLGTSQKKNDLGVEARPSAPVVPRPRTPELDVGGRLTAPGLTAVPPSPPDSTRSTSARKESSSKPKTTTLQNIGRTAAEALTPSKDSKEKDPEKGKTSDLFKSKSSKTSSQK